MLAAKALLVMSSLSAIEAPQLYHFTSEACPACRQVEPTVAELESRGVPIVHVDANQRREWTQQANVTALPTFIVVSNGHEVGRLVGVVPFRELSELYLRAVDDGTRARPSDSTPTQATPARPSQPQRADAVARRTPPPHPPGVPSATTVRGQNRQQIRPAGRLAKALGGLTASTSQGVRCDRCEGECQCQPGTSCQINGSCSVSEPTRAATTRQKSTKIRPASFAAPIPVNGRRPTRDLGVVPVDSAIAATVRLKIVDELGQSFGTGTIIDVHKKEALVLTCGHIFRDSEGNGRILCDSFADGATPGIVGKLISYDLRRDIGLVSFRPGVSVHPVPVGGVGQRPKDGEAVFSVGCNRGADPTVIENEIIAVNRYHGPPNLVVGGRPVDGRSGGGLFDAQGTLIGVCNAADPEYDEGLYAALGNVHAELDSVGLGFVYRKQQSSFAAATNTFTTTSPPSEQAFESGVPPRRFEAKSTPELIASLRSRDDPNTRTEIVIERPSPELLNQLTLEANRRGPHRQTQLQVPSTPRSTHDGGWRSLAQ